MKRRNTLFLSNALKKLVLNSKEISGIDQNREFHVELRLILTD